MMKISQVKEFPTMVFSDGAGGNSHESLLRSYQCLQKVKELLEADTLPSIVLELIAEMGE